VTTLFISHPSALLHDMGPGHPERPDRVRVIEHALEAEPFQMLARERAQRGAVEDILRCHPEAYVRGLEAEAPAQGMVHLDGDTAMNPGTWEAALHGVGGACQAVDEVMAGKAANAFVAMRPPGHHAERATAMGFCFFNNAAIAARRARAVHGAQRVAIMDFDVHHGNGTQDIFWSDPDVMYASTHEMPLYPGTGARSETGEHDTIVNAPLTAGDGGPQFRAAMEAAVLPRLRAFSPDLLIISAGFDAHARDPLAQINLTEEDFAWATHKLIDATQASARGRVVSLLEGGYDLQALARSAVAHVAALMGRAGPARD